MHDPSLDHLIYDGMGQVDKNGKVTGSVRPTSELPTELPPLKPGRINDCLEVLKKLEAVPTAQLTQEQREWAEFVRFKIDDWNSDYDPPA